MSQIEDQAPRVLETRRLRLRPPRPEDAAFHHELHSDERLYRHAPWAVSRDRTANLVGLHSWIERWESAGVDYWVVERRESGLPVGVAGVRLQEDGIANLYYRFAAQAHGQGLGREAARAVTAWASEWVPSYRVRAVARDDNVASGLTAAAAGLVRGGAHDVPGDPPQAGPSRAWWLPRVQVVRGAEHATGSPLREEMLDLWCAVNAAGGAVGFTTTSPRHEVASVLDATLAATDDALLTLAVMRDHEERLRGFGWWVREAGELFRHAATLKRFMVAPEAQGHNLGRVALGGMHAVARGLPGVEALHLTYRSGLGLGGFYAAAGWREVGRVPRAIRVGEDDYRDSVWMVRGIDGRPVTPEGSL